MERIYIQEVAPRDGLQIEDQFLPTDAKVDLVNKLSKTGIDKIEVTSFVSPKAVPNLRDAEEVMKSIDRQRDVTYTTLIPNFRGAERALACASDEVNLVASVSETHNRKNVRQSVKASFENFQDIASFLSGTGMAINGTLATTFGCPFEGSINEDRVVVLVDRYLELGVKGITLADTTGMATPKQVYRICQKVRSRWPDIPITLHFHNTRGMGLANVIEGIRAGVDRYDASLGGLGGCPFAPGATGNICTEDLVHMLQFMDYDTNVNLDELIGVSKYLESLLNHEVPGQVMKAGKITDLYPVS
ncbi:hydroxymethylglutaryl-CoA lyase [Halobacillus mangrovi]|uniref:Hydroxymethylglutaryl-CoA lyase n=1 Tax=Halobacillus mangrovi TaxID=402384 RepID=A0A1W5ZQQ2_9BACI|nr:hydroxymethylglutaryl-CoA lyase [Halobacillus mangrovi]ARI75602.1 hydroxymethylglutaryl-CoA lyase [Halobacillus mangrovi]